MRNVTAGPADLGDLDAAPGPRRELRIGITLLVIAPIVVAVVRALSHHWFPISDDALLYIRARDVLTSHHPLLGSWTSASLSLGVNVNNPGPLYDDLIAPFAHLFSDGPGAAIGVGMVNAASIVAISAVSYALGGWRAQRLMLLACALLTWSIGSELLIDIWQAHALLFPFMLILTLVIGVSMRRWSCLPWLVVVGSVIVQTHISYVYALFVLFASALVIAWRQHPRPPPATALGAWRSRPVGLSGVALAVCWIQPIIEEFTARGKGNLTLLATHVSGGDVQVGIDNSLRLSARILFEPPWRLRTRFSTLIPTALPTGPPGHRTFDFPNSPGAAIAAVLMVVLIGLTVWVARRAHRSGLVFESYACAVASVCELAAVLCVALVTVGSVGLAQHHLRWLWTVGAFVDAALFCTVLQLLGRWWRRRLDRRPTSPGCARGWWASPAVVCTAVLSVLSFPYLAQPQGPVALYYSMPTLRRIFPQLNKLKAVAPVVFDVSTLVIFEPYSSTVMMHLQELGIGFHVTDEGMIRQLGEGRRATGTEPVTIFQLQGTLALNYQGPACMIAGASPLSASDDTRFDGDARAIATSLANGSIEVDSTHMSPQDIQTVQSIAVGDEVLARQVVLDRTLERWQQAGIVAEPGSSADLAGRLDSIDSWADSYYALFMTGSTIGCL